jgi:hypothetical protein
LASGLSRRRKTASGNPDLFKDAFYLNDSIDCWGPKQPDTAFLAVHSKKALEKVILYANPWAVSSLYHLWEDLR